MSVEVLNRLLTLSKDPVPDVRAAAAYALGEARNQTPEIIDCLITLSQDPSPVVKAAAAKALGRLYRPIPKS